METLKKIMKIIGLFLSFSFIFGALALFTDGKEQGLGITFLIIGLIPTILIIRSFKQPTPEEKAIKETKKRERDERFKNKFSGYDISKSIPMIHYKCGHPSLEKPQIFNLAIKEKTIHFMNIKFESVAVIEGDKIKSIVVDDQTTFEKKVTLARMAMVGIFAFALKKNKKNELAYLTISWNDGRFDNDTIFEFEGTGSLQKANRDRNKIINSI